MKAFPEKPTVAVHKFSSCDGCQLAFLNMGADLVTLTQRVEILHFLEAGLDNPNTPVDIAFVEGSLSTADEIERARRVRSASRYVVSIGACATAGGLQALRNLDNSHDQWRDAIYANPQFIETLQHARPIASEIRVDYELWGCPINSRQLLAAINALLFGVPPIDDHDKVCLECKRQQQVCVMVTQDKPCLGPVTRTGCGALCPTFGRDCYGCYGPADNPNTASLSRRFQGLGLLPDAIARRFLMINSGAPAFHDAGLIARSGGNQDD
ncbi:sulfhydrogenase subunit delta [Marinobacterium litorale]|uniref:NADH-quinone oxidoreductase subunit B family protein n=1 Tax=Marinobacterium litorale TaxID=404770 RepID=UPI0003F4BE3A|nr:sulfhydrogenase subunit delta [Marinobacterium litorale]